jgi:predicted PurR-regulated permease PerM
MSLLESDKLKQFLALSIIIALMLFLFFTLIGFVPSFLGAIIFYIICTPAMNFLISKKKMKKAVAALLIIISSIFIILIPIFLCTYFLIRKISFWFTQSDSFYLQLQQANEYIQSNTGIDFFSSQNIIKMQETIANVIPNMLSQSASILGDIGIMYFILYYLLYNETDLEKSLTKYLPFHKKNATLFSRELIAQTYSNVIGAPLLAVIQALAAILGFWIFGLPDFFFWGIMCGFLSFIPFIGSAMVWLPAGILLIANQQHWQGIALLIYGALVITNIDNVFRFVLQKKFADVHPIITVFGVIVGISWFGLPGLIFGPLLISYLLIMIRIYKADYMNIGEQKIEENKNNTDL